MSVASSETDVRQLLETARQALGFDIAYFSKFTSEGQHIDLLAGDAAPFGFGEGADIPFAESYCRRVVEGTAPAQVPDVAAEPRMRDLPAASTLGGYLGVPVRLADGRVYGSLCCASLSPTALDDRDQRYLELLAQALVMLVVDEDASFAVEPSSMDDNSMHLSLWFAGVNRAPMCARAALAVLEPVLGPDLLDGLRLLVTEMMTNCLRHAGVGPDAAIGLDITVTPGKLVGVVSDPGPGFELPETVQPQDDKLGGFGLVILDNISDRWGVRRDRLFRVWFEIEVATHFD